MTVEQQARELLYRAGVDVAINMSAGDLVEIANLIAENARLVEALEQKEKEIKTLQIGVTSLGKTTHDQDETIQFLRSSAARQQEVVWQQCPVCCGAGVVSRPPGIAADQSTYSSSSTGPWTCPTCNGTRIIQSPSSGASL